MNTNDEKLKAMWNKTETQMGSSCYESSAIEKLLSGRSGDSFRKIRNMIIFDIALKVFVGLLFSIDFVLYYGTAREMIVCVTAIVILVPLSLFQLSLLKKFENAFDNGQTLRGKLASMLIYLKSKFMLTLLTISVTYLFVFVSGSMLYFFAAYGFVRPLDVLDIVVFSTFILIGIVFNFAVNRGQVKYQIRYLESCLSDLNDKVLEFVSEKIELQRKQDRTIKILLGLVLILGFVLLIAIFVKVGFID